MLSEDFSGRPLSQSVLDRAFPHSPVQGPGKVPCKAIRDARARKGLNPLTGAKPMDPLDDNRRTYASVGEGRTLGPYYLRNSDDVTASLAWLTKTLERQGYAVRRVWCVA